MKGAGDLNITPPKIYVYVHFSKMIVCIFHHISKGYVTRVTLSATFPVTLFGNVNIPVGGLRLNTRLPIVWTPLLQWSCSPTDFSHSCPLSHPKLCYQQPYHLQDLMCKRSTLWSPSPIFLASFLWYFSTILDPLEWSNPLTLPFFTTISLLNLLFTHLSFRGNH